MDPQPQVSKWVIEYLIRQIGIDDSVLDHLIARLSLDAFDYGVKKGLVIRRIQTEVSKGVVSEKMLKLLELVVEMDFDEGKSPSEPVKSAYCAVALDLTVRFLEVGDYRMYSETWQRIWRDRVEKMEAFGLVTGKLLRWRGALEDASSNVELRDKILSRNTRYEALKAVQRYLAESWNELGPPFLEKIAEDVYNAEKAGQGISPRVGNQGFQNVTQAARGGSVLDKDQGLENVTVAGSGRGGNVLVNEQCLTGLENVTGDGKGVDVLGEDEEVHDLEKLKELVEDYNAPTSSDTPSVETQGSKSLEIVNETGKGGNVPGKGKGLEGFENVTEAGLGDNVVEKEQGLGGLKNVIEARGGITPSDRPCAETQTKQGPSRLNHVGVRRKILHGGGTKVKIIDTEDVDEDPNKNGYHCCPTPEVNQMRANLKSSFADLNAAVRDPLPEALKIAEGVSTNVQKDAGVGGNQGTEMNVDSIPTKKRDRLGANNVGNIGGGGRPEREERGDDNQSVTSDPVEFTQETSPKRRRTTPVKTYRAPKGEMRRQPKKWTVSEEDTLREGVKEFGKGNWKAILMKYCKELEGRTEVDLKDKWRNLTRIVR